MLEEEGRVYFKNVQTYEDCKLVIDNYKVGAVCIYSLDPTINPDAQGRMNYICGGSYALDYSMMSWPKSQYGSLHLHGHIHSKGDYNLQQKRDGIFRYDVGVDANNFYE